MSQLKTDLLAEIEKVLGTPNLETEFVDAGITNLAEVREDIKAYGVKRLSTFNSRLLPIIGALEKISKIRAMVPKQAWAHYKIMGIEGLQEQDLLIRQQHILVEAWKHTRGKSNE